MRISYRLLKQLKNGAITLSALLIATSALLQLPLTLPVAAQQTLPSILNPANPQSTKTYRFPFTMVDPNAQTNPVAAKIPGFRAENQLIIYTPTYGDRTGTNEAGLEAVVENGVIT